MLQDASMSKNILLINPWIYDFAAYDFWMKPLGLLTLAPFCGPTATGFPISIA